MCKRCQSSSFHGIPYENFETFTRPEGMSVLNYINKFDQLYEVIKKYKMDGVLAYRLLECANISKEKQQLARASLTKLTFANTRKQLKAIHDSASDHYDIQAELPSKWNLLMKPPTSNMSLKFFLTDLEDSKEETMEVELNLMAIIETTRVEINLMVIQGVPAIGLETILGR